MPNEELDAMAKMAAIIEPLSPGARSRSVSWLVQSYGIELPRMTVGQTRPSGDKNATTNSFESLADLFHAANPKTDREKALVAAFWIQSAMGVSQFASQSVNAELKQLGFGISNITDALSQLMDDKPSLVIQLKKSGNSKQARKTYKVTDAGNRRVEEMLSQQ